MDKYIQYVEREIDVKRLFLTIIHKLHIIIVFGFIGALVGYLVTIFLVTNNPALVPIFQSKTVLEIKFKDEKDNMQILASRELARSSTVLTQVIDELKLDIDANNLSQQVFVEINESTNELSISVFNEDPNLSKSIAVAVREKTKSFVNSIMDVQSFNSLEDANLPGEPILIENTTNPSDNIFRNTIFGAFLSTFIVLVVILIQFFINDKIQTTSDVERLLGQRVMATIPLIKEKSQRTKF